MSTEAIARLEVDGRHRGTAFVVTRELLVTCAHCVPPERGARATAVFAGGERVRVVVVDPRPEVDLALLAVDLEDALPATALPPALGAAADARRGRPVDVPGWPLDNPASTRPQVLTATVDQPRAWFRDGVEAVRLASAQVAAGARPRGFSGSPAVVRGATGPRVIGVLTWMQEQDDDPERAVGGVVYATPVDVVTAVWPALARPVDRVADLAGGPGDVPFAAAIRETLAARLDGPAGSVPFAGRDDVLARLDRWLADGAAHHVLGGPAGIGKSTVALRWALRVIEAPDRHVVFVPVGAAAELTRRRPVVRALAHRLAAVHGEVLDEGADTDDLAESVRARLARPAPAGTTVLVVLDALDEAVGWVPGRLLPRAPGPGVRLLVTARWTAERPSTTAWCEALELPAAATTDLGPLTRQAVGELITQIRPDAADGDVAAAAERLSARTGGDPITTALHLRDLAGAATALRAWSGVLADVPPGLDGVVDRWWREQQEAWAGTGRADDAERVLGLLVAAHGPLRRADVAALGTRIAEPLDGVRLQGALGALERLTLPGPGEDSVVVAHPALTETLRRRDRDTGSGPAFVRWGLDVLDGLVGDELEAPAVPAYLVAHLAEHLTEGPVFRPEALRLLGATWSRVHDATATDADAFHRDVNAVAEQARRLDEARTGPPRLLPERVLCAATAAGERRATATTVTPELAHALVHHGIWRAERGIAHVHAQIPERSGNRAVALAALVPDVPVEAFEPLSAMLDAALDTTYPEIRAQALAAWASRLLDEGFVAEALAAPDRLAPDDRHHGFVRAWVVADLADRLPDELLAPALAAALAAHVPGRGGGNGPYALGRLVRAVSRDRAGRLWPLVEPRLPDEVRERADEVDDGDGRPAAVLRAVLGDQPGEDLGAIFVGGDPARGLAFRFGPAFAAAAPWFDAGEIAEALVVIVRHADEPPPGALPDVNDDGALCAATPASAPALVEAVRERWTGRERVCGLALLLPHLTGGLRDAVADALLASPLDDLRSFDNAANLVHTAVPGLVEAGCTDLLLDAVSRLDHHYGILHALVEHLDLAQVERALALWPSDLLRRRLRGRQALLDRSAAIRALETARGSLGVGFDPGAIVPYLQARLARLDAGEEPARPPHTDAWWHRTYLTDRPAGGARRVPTRHGRRLPADLALTLALVDDDTGADALVELAADLAVHLAAGHRAPDATDVLAAAERLRDPWAGLVLLAAATHASGARDPVHEAVRATVTRIRAPVDDHLARLAEIRPTAPTPPWLFAVPHGWAPFVARLVAPASRPVLAELLLDGGVARWTDTDDRRDDRTTVLLALTPLLDRAELTAFAGVVERAGTAGGIDSGTLRPWARAGLAVGWAAAGELERAYEVAREADAYGDTHLKTDVLAEILDHVPDEALPRWLTVAHGLTDSTDERGALWGQAEHRLPELSDAAAREAVEQWLGGAGAPSTRDVLGDAVFYLPLIARLAGLAECRRLVALLAG